jgi:hypothetical protein
MRGRWGHNRDDREYRDDRDGRDSRDAWKSKDYRDDHREARDYRNKREDHRDHRDEFKNPRGYNENRGFKDSRAYKGRGEYKEYRDSREEKVNEDSYQYKEQREVSGYREPKDAKEIWSKEKRTRNDRKQGEDSWDDSDEDDSIVVERPESRDYHKRHNHVRRTEERDWVGSRENYTKESYSRVNREKYDYNQEHRDEYKNDYRDGSRKAFKSDYPKVGYEKDEYGYSKMENEETGHRGKISTRVAIVQAKAEDDTRRNPEKSHQYKSGYPDKSHRYDNDQNPARSHHAEKYHISNISKRGDHYEELYKQDYWKDSHARRHHENSNTEPRKRRYDKPDDRSYEQDHAKAKESEIKEYGHHRGQKPKQEIADGQKREFEVLEDEKSKQRYYERRSSKGDNVGKYGSVKIENIISNKEDDYPQILKDLAPSGFSASRRFNKNSKEFSLQGQQSTLTIPSATAMPIPSALGINQSASGLMAMKESDLFPNMNNYSNNTFSQMIFINPQGQQMVMGPDGLSPLGQQNIYPSQIPVQLPMGQQQQMTPNMYAFGGMPAMHQLGSGMIHGQVMPAQQMQTPINQNQMMGQMANMMPNGFMNSYPLMNQQYGTQQSMAMMNPQMVAMMQMMQGNFNNINTAGYGQQSFAGDMTDDQIEFMSMLEMFRDNMDADNRQPEEDIEKLLEEVEFERRQEQVNRLDEESRNCPCCRGFPLKCRAVKCENIGMCHCALRRNRERQPTNKEQIFIQKRKNCSCCKGLIYACKGAACVSSGQCNCMMS